MIPHRHSQQGYGGVLALLPPQHHWGAVSPLTPCLQPQSRTPVFFIHPFICLSVHPADAKQEDTEGPSSGWPHFSVGRL